MADNDTPMTTDGPTAATTGGATGSNFADARQTLRDNASSVGQQAADKVRLFAEDGKAKAGDALGQLAQLLTDAAAQVDTSLGEQYGGYARSAASTVQGFAQTVRDKDVDDLADDVRGFVRASPVAALGITAALGFALARMVHAGLDQRD